MASRREPTVLVEKSHRGCCALRRRLTGPQCRPLQNRKPSSSAIGRTTLGLEVAGAGVEVVAERIRQRQKVYESSRI